MQHLTCLIHLLLNFNTIYSIMFASHMWRTTEAYIINLMVVLLQHVAIESVFAI